MLRFVTSRRRLLRKRMYRAPHQRQKVNTYYRENKNRVKAHQESYKNQYSPIKKRKLRPKREVTKGYKMAYRYRYYNNVDDLIEDDELVEESLQDE